MLKIYICEDSQKQLDMITKAVEKAILDEELDMKVETSTSDPFEILHIVEQSNGPGIYFLDVELNAKIDGIELASKIRNYDPRGFIVFVTTHPELSYLTFKYNRITSYNVCYTKLLRFLMPAQSRLFLR